MISNRSEKCYADGPTDIVIAVYASVILLVCMCFHFSSHPFVHVSSFSCAFSHLHRFSLPSSKEDDYFFGLGFSRPRSYAFSEASDVLVRALCRR